MVFWVIEIKEDCIFKKPFPVKPGSIRSRKKDEDFLEIAELDLKLVLGSVNQADLVAVKDSSVEVDQRLQA